MKILLILIISIFIIKPASANNKDLILNIRLNKTEYVEGEPIFLQIIAINNSNKNLIFFPEGQELIYIIDKNGRRYHNRTPFYINYRKNFFKGDTIEKTINIQSEYGENYHQSHYPYFPQGDYKVYVMLKDEVEKVEVKSNMLIFVVKKPDSSQEQILKKLIQAYELSPKTQKTEKREIYRYLLESFTKNPYRDYIIYLYVLTYFYTSEIKNLEFFKLCNSLLHTYPSNKYNKILLIGLLNYFKINKNQEGAKKYFEGILKENLDPGLNKNIKKIILKRILTKPIKDW